MTAALTAAGLLAQTSAIASDVCLDKKPRHVAMAGLLASFVN